MTHTPENLLTVWADALVGALADAGVSEVVASPGSRSTPFLLAALRSPRLVVHSVIDERSAGFFALGMARATGRPPALLCTSGSAPAHYYPAVIEACESALPLVVISADRPRELIRAGAPQTTDQHRLYGVHARAFHDLGAPHGSRTALSLMRSAVAALVATALGPEPGPVQINAPARKPLEPVEATSEAGHALAQVAATLAPAPRAAPSVRHLDPTELDGVLRALAEAERPALVAGPSAGRVDAALDLARRQGMALLAEASSQLRFTEREGVLVADRFGHWIERAALAPDLVLEIGATPTSGEYARWLAARGPRRRFVLGGARFRDPSGRADGVLLGDTAAILGQLLERVGETRRPAWRDAVEAQEARSAGAVERALASTPFSDAHAACAVVAAMPEHGRLALGNSLPIRSVDRYVTGDRAFTTSSARGVNGIDGWIAATAGAVVADGVPTAALIGDVTAAHDVGSLSLAAGVSAPLAVVVVDNRGGRIFEELPIAARVDDGTMARFTTPPSIDFEAAARAFGVRYAASATERETSEAVRAALSTSGATLVHVRVADRGARAVLDRVRVEMA